jgi:5-methylcytosine-specific restriction endonuclease McrA
MATESIPQDDGARKREDKLAKKRDWANANYAKNRETILRKLKEKPKKAITESERIKRRERQKKRRETGKRREYERDYENKNRDKINAQRRARNAADPSISAKHKRKRRSKPEVKAAEKAYMAEWTAKNKEHRRKYNKDWAKRNRELLNLRHRIMRACRTPAQKIAVAIYMRAWAKRNPNNIKANRASREAKERGAVGRFTASDITDIRRGQRDRCAYCRKPLMGGGHKDHIIAVKNKGTNKRSNIQLTCAKCNRSKSARDPIEFARSIGLLI